MPSTLKNHETGMALIVTILVLFVLTALGMALLLTATTELDISTNYRWSEMAFFNAESGLEYAKNVLGYIGSQAPSDQVFKEILPPPRTTAEAMKDKPEAPLPSSRDYQYCIDQDPGAGTVLVCIGKILVDPLQNRRLEFNLKLKEDPHLSGGQLESDEETLTGTVTVWVRRPIVAGLDDQRNDRLILTAEGTAPNFENPLAGRAGAVRRLEVLLQFVSLKESTGRLDQPEDETKSSGTGVRNTQVEQTDSTLVIPR